MRFKYLTTALWFGAAAVAAPLGGALAADSFGTQLYSKSQLGPQVVDKNSPMNAGDEIRLTVTASEPVTVSVIWQSSSGESKALLNDTKLSAGQSINVPGGSNWLELQPGEGVQSFTVFSTDAQGNVEQEQVATLVLNKDVAMMDQKTFSSLGKASGGATSVKGFSSFSSKNLQTRQTPTFASAPGLPKQPQAPATPAPEQPAAPTPEPQASQEPQFEPVDMNGDGKVDAYAADTNGDGYYDFVLVDESGDGNIDYALLDTNYNGTFDTALFPVTDQGKTYDIWAFDENEDGTWDYYGFDWDQDGTIDDWQKA